MVSQNREDSKTAKSKDGPFWLVFKASKLTFGSIAFPVFLALCSAVFEGLSTGMLIPILNGFLGRNFSFFAESRIGRVVNGFLPEAIRTNPQSLFAVMLIGLVLLTLLRIGLGYAASAIFATQLKYGLHHLRSNLFKKILANGKLFFDRNKLGELSNVILQLTVQLSEQLNGLQFFLQNVFLLTAYVILMFLISWKLTLFAFALGPIYYFATTKLSRKLRAGSLQYAEIENNLSDIFFNVVGNVSLVKSCAQESEEVSRFSKISDESYVVSSRMDRNLVAFFPLQETIALFAALSIVGFIVVMVGGNAGQDVSKFLVFFYVLKRTTTALSALGQFRGTAAKVHGLAFEMSKLLEPDQGTYIVPNGDLSFQGLRNEIQVDRLSYSYDNEAAVLKDISLTFRVGEVTALVGPSGSGKSTLVHLLLRLYDCPPSTIRIDGTDIREFDKSSLRSRMALVSQHSSLFSMSLRENLVYGLKDISDDEIMDALAKAQLEEFVTNLPEGLNTRLGDRGVRLSGGQQQRVSVARAMLREPEILILDEATSALDASTERLVQTAIDQLVHGRTVIVIAHRFSTLQHADKIVTLSDGRVVESGTLQDLLDTDGIFSRLWKDQELFR